MVPEGGVEKPSQIKNEIFMTRHVVVAGGLNGRCHSLESTFESVHSPQVLRSKIGFPRRLWKTFGARVVAWLCSRVLAVEVING